MSISSGVQPAWDDFVPMEVIGDCLKDKIWVSPLYTAVKYRQLQCVEKLLAGGANVNNLLGEVALKDDIQCITWQEDSWI